MHRSSKYGLILIPILLLVFSGSAAGSGPSAQELALFDLINAARENPLDMASSLGMDADRVLEDLPDLREILTKGLPPLAFNAKLYAAAREHTLDMLANNYVAHDSLDGKTYEDRIIKNGYMPAASGESLAVLGFANFVKPAEAVLLIFENIFRDELSPAKEAKRNILNPNMRDVGVSLLGGALEIEGTAGNAYVATCDFAGLNTEHVAIGTRLLQLVNHARRDPYTALESSIILEDDGGFETTDWGRIISTPLSPLARNEKLTAAATAHVKDMIKRAYFASVSPDGKGPFDRIDSTGYGAFVVGETLGWSVFADSDTPREIAASLFAKMLEHEMTLGSAAESNIFNPEISEMGVGVAQLTAEPEGTTTDRLFLLVVEFAAPAETRYFVLGTVYEDKNLNGRADAGEEAAGLDVVLKPGFDGAGPEQIIPLGALGYYQVEVPPFSFYDLYVKGDKGDILAESLVVGQSENQQKNFLIMRD